MTILAASPPVAQMPSPKRHGAMNQFHLQKSGIYGEMFVTAMLAAAAVCENTCDVILAGIGQIAKTSRLYEAITNIIGDYASDVLKEECFTKIHAQWNGHNGHCWTQTIPNAAIVTASLICRNGDYTKSICMIAETGFDTDCNGTTVEAVLGMMFGIEHIPPLRKSS